MNYRPEIQGLRAIAIGLVLIFHIWPSTLPGGFVGVDVFFVLSGFLITSILIAEADNGSIHLASFWARRIRRLLPAATLVLIVTFAAACLILPETQIQRTAEQTLASALYAQNWILALQSTNYLSRSEVPTAVQHFWSLSIEEQFYLVWPFLVFLASTFTGKNSTRGSRRGAIAIVSLTILISSFTWAIVRTSAADPSAYFATTTRAWELALGALLATIPSIRGPWRIAAAWMGLSSVCVSAYAAGSETQFPGWIALLPTFGTGLVLLGGAQHGSLAWIASAPMKWLGDVSYSLYLWHWPLIVLGRPYLANLPGPLDGVCLLALSLLLATITHYTIENWFRAKPGETTRAWPAYLTGLALVALVVNPTAGLTYSYRQAIIQNPEPQLKLNDPDYPGATILDPEIVKGREASPAQPAVPIRPNPMNARTDWPRLYNDGCDQRQLAGAQFCEYGNPLSATIVVLAGDSHAAQYLPALEILAAYHDWRLRVLTRSACSLNTAPIRRGGIVLEDCEQWKKRAVELIVSAKPKLVITSGAIPAIYNEVYQLASTADQVKGYQTIWARLALENIQVIAIRDNPRPMIDVPACIASNSSNPGACSKPRTDILDSLEDPVQIAAQEYNGAGKPNVQLLDLSRWLCVDALCPGVIGNVLVYRDGDHLTASYVKTLAPALERSILPELKKN